MFVLILGLGRTGLHLAKHLIMASHQVAGTTRAPNKDLVGRGVIPIIWSSSHGTQALPEADYVVCAFPPTDTYPIQLAALIARYHATPIIQISSTGVFAGNQGIINEASLPITSSSRSLLLYEAEQYVLTHPLGQVVRAGGLYDEKNHPVHFLSGKKEIKGPHSKVNLVHREDLSEIIFNLITTNESNRITHAVHPDHPTKLDYYTRKAQEYNIEAPSFDFECDTELDKTVTSRLKREWRSL